MKNFADLSLLKHFSIGTNPFVGGNKAMSDSHHSAAWQEAYGSNDIFEGDPRGKSLSSCTDGVSPFAHNRGVVELFIVCTCITG